MSMSKGTHNESVIEVIEEDDTDFFSEFVRHKVVYNGLVSHKQCVALSSTEILQLRRREKKLEDFCRMCVFLTLFNEQALKNSDRCLFWKLILKVDPDDTSKSTGYDHLEYARMSVKENKLLDNTLRTDGVLIDLKDEE